MNVKRRAAWMLVLLTLFLSGCTGFHSNQTLRDGALEYYVSAAGTRAFPVRYTWSGKLSDTRIEIPDEVNGARVISLGGYYGTGVPIRMVITQEGDFTQEERTLPEGVKAEYLTFTLRVGKNVKTVVGVEFQETYLLSRAADGSVRYFLPLIVTECDDRNLTFYDKNGKLYTVDDDRLEDAIQYGERPLGFQRGTLRITGTSMEITEYEWIRTENGAALIKYLGPWPYVENGVREDYENARKEGGEEFYEELCAVIGRCGVMNWDGFDEIDPWVLDGYMFSFEMTLAESGAICASGSNAYPEGYRDFIKALEEILAR